MCDEAASRHNENILVSPLQSKVLNSRVSLCAKSETNCFQWHQRSGPTLADFSAFVPNQWIIFHVSPTAAGRSTAADSPHGHPSNIVSKTAYGQSHSPRTLKASA